MFASRPTTALLLASCFASFPAYADDEFEAKAEAELTALAPEAIEDWRAANAAREAHELAEARTGYKAVLERAPSFTHARRRLCSIEAMDGHVTYARELCEQAYREAPTPENATQLADALARPTEGADAPRSADQDRAQRLAREATGGANPHEWSFATWCQISLEKLDHDALRTCARRYRDAYPENPGAYVFTAFAKALDDDIDGALASLQTAHAKGLPDDAYEEMQGTFTSALPLHLRVWRATRVWGAAWLVTLAILVGVGFLLSRATLRAAERTHEGTRATVGGAEANLRRIYGAVLWLTCVFYYVSLPFVALAVLGLAGLLVYFFLAIGHIPIKLMLVVVVVAAVSVFAMLKGLVAVFTRGADEDPGDRLDLDAHPKLRAALDAVAAKVGTRPVDNVYIVPGCDIAVFERGSMSRRLRGHTERCLILGVGVLDEMEIEPFKAILAHEYGHFHNEDTAGGGFALGVRRSMITMAIGIAEGGGATWFNPAWLFFRGFHWVFMHVSHGATRLQEVLADRWAALAYGSEAFAAGLRHAIRRDLAFDAHVGAALEDMVDNQRVTNNFYTFEPSNPIEASKVDEALEEAMNREPDPLDSHPAPHDRIRWVRAMGVASPGEPDAAEPVWSLFSDPAALQESMTRTVRSNVLARYGVDITRGPTGMDVDA